MFQDSANTVTVTLPVGTTTSSTAIDTLTATVTSSSLGYSNATLSLRESDVDSLYFYSPINSSEITFSSAYNPAAVNTIHFNLQLQSLDTNGESASATPISISLSETSAGSGTFVDSVSGLTVTLTNFTGTNSGSVDSMVASFSGGVVGTTALSTTLTETTATSKDFTAYTTTGDSSSSGQGSDITPDDPQTTGDGVFYIRLKGISGLTSLSVQTDIGAAQTVAMTPMTGDPTTVLSDKLIIVPQDVDAMYSTIQGKLATNVTGIPAMLTMSLVGSTKPMSKVHMGKGMFIGMSFWSGFAQDFSLIRQALGLGTGGTAEDGEVLNNVTNVLPKANTGLKLLGTGVTDGAVTGPDFTAALPRYEYMYLLSHSVGLVRKSDGTLAEVPFQEIALQDSTYFDPPTVTTLVASNSYKLVFLNGCKSATKNQASQTVEGTSYSDNSVAMAAAFKCRVYVGWDSEVDAVKAARAGVSFFTTLATGTPATVHDATVAASASLARINPATGLPQPDAAQCQTVVGDTLTADNLIKGTSN